MFKRLKKKISVILCIALVACNNLVNFSFVFADEIEEVLLSTESNITSVGTDSDIINYVDDEELSDDEDDGSNTYYNEEPEEDVVEDSMTGENNNAKEAERESGEESEDVEVTTPSEVDLYVATSSEVIEESDIVATMSEMNNILFGVENVASESNILWEHGLGYIPSNYVADISKNKNNGFPLFGAESLPDVYDGREVYNSAGLPIVPPIRDQGNYGVCWAFSTIAMIETSIRKQNLVTTEEESDLSEAALAYYYYNLDTIYDNPANMDIPGLEGKDYMKLPAGSESWAQRGGNQKLASALLASYVGVVKEDNVVGYDKMPEIISNGIDGQYAYHKNKFNVKNIRYINKSDKESIKRAIMQNGSVAMNYYSGGGLLGGRYMNRKDGDCYYLTSGQHSADHAVVIVGWNDNIPGSYFGYGTPETNPHYATTDVNGAWLVRNSWGTDVGDLLNEGYFWMSYAEPNMEATLFTIEAMKADTYKYNYHYDTVGVGGRGIAGSVGNIFRVKGESNEDQILEAISISLTLADQTFRFKIYTNDNPMTHPEDGDLRLTQVASGQEAGIYTIPLNESISLADGSYFSIVLESIGGMLWIETSINQIIGMPGMEDFYNMLGEGQSYIYDHGWQDCNAGLHDSYSTEWNRHNYCVRGLSNPASGIGFNANGGTGTMARLDGTGGSLATIPANTFTKEGYAFDKWTTESNGSGDIYHEGESIAIPVDGAMTLYAQWIPIHYILKLNANGQTGADNSHSYAYDEEVDLANPGFTSEDYTLGGWQTIVGTAEKVYDIGQTGVKGLASSEGDEYTLYAHWIPGSYILNFNGNGATSGSMSSQTIEVGQSANLIPNTYEKIGYKFIGWATASNTDMIYADGALFNKVDAHKDETYVLYAKWAPITYTIKYNPNGGTISPDQVTKTYGSNLNLDTPARNGYDCVGWYKEEGLINQYNGEVDLSSTQGDIINVYAKWVLAAGYIEAQYETNGGGNIYSQAILPGETFVRPSNPSKSGYIFDNWYKEPSFINAYDFSNIATQSVILYANWNQVSNNNSSRRSSNSGSSGSSSGVNVGPLAKGMTKNNAPKQENAQQVSSRSVDIVVSLTSINWQVDPVSGKIKLGLDKNNPSVVAANGFFAIPSLDANGNAKNDIYNFDAEGNMVTGWAKDTEGKMYFFETTEGINIGKMLVNLWKEVDTGKWYYFGADGKMMTNGITPDGYMVGADGLWQ